MPGTRITGEWLNCANFNCTLFSPFPLNRHDPWPTTTPFIPPFSLSLDVCRTPSHPDSFQPNPLTARRRPCVRHSFSPLFLPLPSFRHFFSSLSFSCSTLPPVGLFFFSLFRRESERGRGGPLTSPPPNFISFQRQKPEAHKLWRERGNHDSTPPPVITYPGILTSRTFDRAADCLDENFVISVARIRVCNGVNLRYYKIEIGGGGGGWWCALEEKLLDSFSQAVREGERRVIRESSTVIRE